MKADTFLAPTIGEARDLADRLRATGNTIREITLGEEDWQVVLWYPVEVTR